MNKILVSSIAFNEHVKIKTTIERFLNCAVRNEVDYLVVDDGSDDETTSIIQSFADKDVKTIKHTSCQGVGAAIRTAINYAREHHYTFIVIMAGNNKDNPDELPRIIDPLLKENYDFIQGSRYKEQGCVGGDMPSYRKIATKIHPAFMSLIAKRKLTDSTNGFRGFRLSLLENKDINLNQDWLNQYELEPYLLYKTIRLGYKFKEVPVTKIYPPKKIGYTKMSPITGWWSILRPLVFLGLGIKK